MIDVVAKFYVDPAKVDEFTGNAKELLDATHKNDVGCIKYELYRDINDPLLFVFMETWADQAAVDAHSSAKHFTTIIPKLIAVCTKDLELISLAKYA